MNVRTKRFTFLPDSIHSSYTKWQWNEMTFKSIENHWMCARWKLLLWISNLTICSCSDLIHFKVVAMNVERNFSENGQMYEFYSIFNVECEVLVKWKHENSVKILILSLTINGKDNFLRGYDMCVCVYCDWSLHMTIENWWHIIGLRNQNGNRIVDSHFEINLNKIWQMQMFIDWVLEMGRCVESEKMDIRLRLLVRYQNEMIFNDVAIVWCGCGY